MEINPMISITRGSKRIVFIATLTTLTAIVVSSWLKPRVDAANPDNFFAWLPLLSNTQSEFTRVQRGETLRINTGSNWPFIDSKGRLWQADRSFVGGTPLTRPDELPVPHPIYLTERYGMTDYAIPIENGAYRIVLHFAETFPGINANGQRIFQVTVEGETLKEIDIISETGGRNIPTTRLVNTTVTDAELNIQFSRGKQKTVINAIEVIPIASINLPNELRINIGGPQFTTLAGDVWEADRGFTGGKAVDRGEITISGSNLPIYSTERHSMSGYDLPLQNGTYLVRLHFAETYPPIQESGRRRFHVEVENERLSDLDVFTEAGGSHTALVKEVTVSVMDELLDIRFFRVRQNPELNGIEVRLLNGDIPATSTPTRLPLTSTPNQTSTPTIVVPTATKVLSTLIPSPTSEPIPTDIPTEVPPTETKTPTNEPPTATFTLFPTLTATPTATSNPPSPSSTPSNVPPTAVPTITPKPIQVVPTATIFEPLAPTKASNPNPYP